MKTVTLRRALCADRWFQACPEAMQGALIALGRPTQLSHGESLFQMGDQGHGLYCVLQGALLISNINEEGKVSVLSQVEPVQWFGEIATLDRGPRHFSAHANGETEVLCVDGPGLEEWLNAHPLHWRHIGILASSKLRVALDVLQESAFLPLEQRILRRLERIASGYGSRVTPQRHVRVPQEVIAQMMGISRQSANKALKTLEESGLIARNYGMVELLTKP
jgi:CRP/FNR family cyclic AMP-dependent transcriptional regulator